MVRGSLQFFIITDILCTILVFYFSKLRIFYMVYDKSQYFGSHLENCPPNDALTASGVVYRFVFHDPPNEKDFVTYAEEDPDKYNDLCIAHGVSVFKDLIHINKTKNRFKDMFRDAKLAIANLTSECGYIKKTSKKKAHYTWWMPPNTDVWELFEVVQQQ